MGEGVRGGGVYKKCRADVPVGVGFYMSVAVTRLRES